MMYLISGIAGSPANIARLMCSAGPKHELVPEAPNSRHLSQSFPAQSMSSPRHAAIFINHLDSCNRTELFPGAAPETVQNVSISGRSNVHQNVHQKIQTDRVGYVRIRPDLLDFPLETSQLHSDSDPLPMIQADTIGYGWINLGWEN